ncbi:MAG: hypothetical protein F6J98_15795 [Moorea sp. SIO4G2]|uniref:hypothetical protein n=1 Tax=unclassified Moorena TaxID=2683338 RepID=UPI0013F6B5FB|nr:MULTISPECIES: hypothetical protein [unclassified Moorena]NEO16098.1 hypothetical protein [Moorena sp. SIO3E8]NEO61812.1 hypothetical protein [Moorena sp. SIO4G2]NEP27927.1 hypothetical protein [Moorena sp. SIO3I6]NEQ02603.1 hypothetical protein [Moorena sp. SIO3F7]
MRYAHAARTAISYELSAISDKHMRYAHAARTAYVLRTRYANSDKLMGYRWC